MSTPVDDILQGRYGVPQTEDMLRQYHRDPLVPDFPSAEPAKDILAQLGDLADKNHPRSAVYLSKEALNGLPQHMWPALGAGIPLHDFDGKGGLLLAKDGQTALAARGAKSNGMPLQELIGRLTGSGTGKPIDGTHVVQQVLPGGAVTRESGVNSRDVAQTLQQFAAPGRSTRVLSPIEVQQRRRNG